MNTSVTSLDLSPGAAVVLDGTEWLVERAEPQYGSVALVAAGGQRMTVRQPCTVCIPVSDQPPELPTLRPLAADTHLRPGPPACAPGRPRLRAARAGAPQCRAYPDDDKGKILEALRQWTGVPAKEVQAWVDEPLATPLLLWADDCLQQYGATRARTSHGVSRSASLFEL